MLQYIFYFIIYSLIGWIIDTTCRSLRAIAFVANTYVPGFSITYGIGSLIIIFLIKYIKKLNIFLKYFIYAIVLTLYEYISAIWTEFFLGMPLWDYSNHFLNFQGRIDLFHFIAWGLLGLLFEYKLHPFISELVKKIKK